GLLLLAAARCWTSSRPPVGASPVYLPEVPGPSDAAEAAHWAVRATKWRSQHGMSADEDFAFCFTAAEQASRIGPWLAYEWVTIRRQESQDLARAAAGVFASPNVADAPPARPPLPRARVSCRQVIRQTRDQMEAREAAHVDQLAGILLRASPPARAVSMQEQQDLTAAATQKAQQIVATSEPATIAKAVCTWDELISFLQGTGRSFVDLLPATLDCFVHDHKAPGRAFTSLKWLAKNLQIELPADKVTQPASLRPKAASGEGSRQAPVLEPVMLATLERAVVSYHQAGHPAWHGILGHWIQATGCLRIAHLQRAVILRVSPYTIHCHCSKGKQRQLRVSGFDFAVPRHFLSVDFDWWEAYKPQYLAVAPGQQREIGLLFDVVKKAPLTQAASVQAIREALAAQVREVSMLTSYSAGRVLPTFAALVGLDPLEAQALSDWQMKSTEAAASQMPQRYNTTRCHLSVRIKLPLARALSLALRSREVTTWEGTGVEVWKAWVQKATPTVDIQITQEATTDWGSILLAARSARRFVLRPPAMAYRQDPLLHVVPGKVVLLRMKNRAEHRCGILTRNGRICGGQHTALTCKERRAWKAEDYLAVTEPVQPAAGPTTSQGEPPALPVVELDELADDGAAGAAPEPSSSAVPIEAHHEPDIILTRRTMRSMMPWPNRAGTAPAILAGQSPLSGSPWDLGLPHAVITAFSELLQEKRARCPAFGHVAPVEATIRRGEDLQAAALLIQRLRAVELWKIWQERRTDNWQWAQVPICQLRRGVSRALVPEYAYWADDMLAALAFGRDVCPDCQALLPGSVILSVDAMASSIAPSATTPEAVFAKLGAKFKLEQPGGIQADTRERDQSKASIQDLDDPLDDSALSDLKGRFWRRYKLSFPPEVHPADSLISRLSRELSKRMLMVANLWLVRTLMYQVTTNRKRLKLAEHLYTDVQEEVGPASHDLYGYLSRLHTCLIALAMAGVQPLANVTDFGPERELGADTTRFLEVPLDLLIAYYYRATRSLGQVIREVMQMRDADWLAEGIRLDPASPPVEGPETVSGKPVRYTTSAGDRGPAGSEEAAHPVGRGISLPQSPQPKAVDLFSGPNSPVTLALRFCGWHCTAVDWSIDPSHDLASKACQQWVRGEVAGCHFLMAAFDCSTKSRAREIPRQMPGGRPAPPPLRSESHPRGLPALSARDQQLVDTDNASCDFVLEEILALAQHGGVSVRENSLNSLHWCLEQEVQMEASGVWADYVYDACCFQGARCKRQRLRHNLPEIMDWPEAQCRHLHQRGEWEPGRSDSAAWFPTKDEAEYTAAPAFSIAVAASWWAARMSIAKLRVPRMRSITCSGDRRQWLEWPAAATRQWAMAPTAIALGLDISACPDYHEVPTRRSTTEFSLDDLKAEGPPQGLCLCRPRPP
ncbi:unnamed protein product, partial [Effrenium voratum]